ncbi:DegV family protein [Halonatronum saccharophilum]|uniref:DegV family protein n=1 Tax=Halonatronum saccharophilum TaxID=150060 RepID=UPI00047F3375|nr:DegV family protein [Halonatronum saccharophilum]
MGSIKIITDSGSDLTKELIEDYDISVLPIPVKLGESNYKDGEDITPEEFYQKLEESDSLPVTSMITPYTFEEKFKSVLEDYDQIIYISFSSQLSGICNSARIAAKIVDQERIYVIDSKAATLGLGLIVLKAAKLLKEGNDKDVIIKEVEDMIERIEHIFAVGSLDMLKKGGRISSTKALVGSLLNITPILEVTQEGKIVPLSKVRGEKRFIKYMIDVMKERGDLLKEEAIGISHGNNLQLAQKLAERIKKEFGLEDILITQLGAAIGSHAGPGTVALFFQ